MSNRDFRKQIDGAISNLNYIINDLEKSYNEVIRMIKVVENTSRISGALMNSFVKNMFHKS